MTTEIISTEYVMSHGKEPRGKGSWAFATTHNSSSDKIFFTPGNTSYGDAKKLATKHFHNVPLLFVLP